MNKIFTRFYKQKVFTTAEANKIIRNYQVCKNTLNRLLHQKLIKRVKPLIYHIVPLDNPDFYPDQIHIATLLRPDAVISGNTALQIYKLHQPEDTIYISSKHASKLRIKEYTYKIMKDQHNIGINKSTYDTGYATINIKITDIERTLIDCVWNRSIKIESIIKTLKEHKTDINMKLMMKYLEKYKKPILYNKIGLILDELNILTEHLEQIHAKLTKKTFYVKEKGLTLMRPRYKYHKRWNIMIPEHLMEKLTKQA